MPRSESDSPAPAAPEDDDAVVRVVTAARRNHKALGIALEHLAKAARKTTRRGQAPVDSANKERSAGK